MSKVIKIRAFQRLIGPRWSVEILAALTQGPRRWTELVHVLTVTSGKTVHSRSLSYTLRQLQDNGIVHHTPVADDVAAYCLTPEGHELVKVLDEIASWAERHSKTLGL